MIFDARGQHMRLKSQDTSRSIQLYFDNNPTAYKKQCARDLGLSVQTVRKHLKLTKQED